jgi:hypothetical protein
VTGDRDMRLDVNITLYGNDGTRLGVQEAVDIKGMDFHQIAKLLEAFHVITEAVREGRNVSLNGQELRYFQ